MNNSPRIIPASKIPLPEPMTAMDPESWAYETVTRRWPEIARRITVENDLVPSIVARIDRLIDDIPHTRIRSIKDPRAPDAKVWNQDIGKHAGKSWLEPAWFFTEHYFYRRVIEAIGFYQNGAGEMLDPFAYQKNKGLQISREFIHDLTDRVESWKGPGGDLDSLVRMLYLDLWGNQADLSMWPAEGQDKPDHNDLDLASNYLLEDRAAEVADHIFSCQADSLKSSDTRIDFLVDNAGFELVCDMILADYLLSCGLATAVRLHVKSHPTYVSDATILDVKDTLSFLKADQDKLVKALGLRLTEWWQRDILQVRDNFFWTSPLPGWEMPLPVERELSRSSLVISKGDANYRRLLGDLDWPYTTPFQDILSYFPVPIVALRTVKAEIACGLSPGQAEHVAARDPEWMINGRWGFVQFNR
jgi:uncharacterized protein with ATP-grasp and redox domains